MRDNWQLLAGDEYYEPWHTAPDDPGALAPSRPPGDWVSRRHSVWCHWSPPEGSAPLASQGWKVHVSAAPERLADVLDVVAEACFEAGVSFKHLGTSGIFLLMHQKHAQRVQAGKFCALYPGEQEAARALMARLATELADEQGAYVLTDRRFGTTGVVHYRHGAFVRRERLRLDGSSEQLIQDGEGNDVPDQRRPSFVLPSGIVDPFAPAARVASEPTPKSLLLGDRFAVESVIRHSNGGGAYQGRDTLTGATVFIKEARAHNGYTPESRDAREQLRREHRTLTEIHAKEPGLCPEPLGYFTRWEHEFLVTEHIDGVPLLTWYAMNQPLAQWDTDAERRSAYYGDVEKVLDSLDEALDRLHAMGLRFGDLSHGNVMVKLGRDDGGDGDGDGDGDGGDGRIRLIDFETVTALDEPPMTMGTTGYMPPPELRESGVEGDDYGAAALAMLLLFPLARPLQLDPAGRLAVHRRDLDRNLAVPEGLWTRATRFYGPITAPRDVPESPWPLPSADDLDDDPDGSLRALGDGLAAGILAMAQPDRAEWLFPPGPNGHATNTVCLAHGTAGVLHGLKQWGVEIPKQLVQRFRRDAVDIADQLAPGFQAGLAGISVVLAEFGHGTEAADLLEAAAKHPLAEQSVLLGDGAAGIGLAELRVHALTGDRRRLETASRIADRLLADDLSTVLDQAGTAGLEQGLSGVALFLAALGRVTDAAQYTSAAVRLMHAELDKGQDHEDGLRFLDAGDRRVITYLAIGSAGVATALGRIGAWTGDERCREALPRVVSLCRATSSLAPGLFTGHASWVYTLADNAHHSSEAAARQIAVRVATSLTKYMVRFPGGLRTLGPFELRFHCDLATGDAGVLLALAHVLGRTETPSV